jgi:hypothetical protein
VLHLGQRLGLDSGEALLGAYGALHSHRVAGGIATYARVEEIRAFVRLPEDFDVSGWSSPHTCVTAAVAGLERLRHPLIGDLLAAQKPDGSWKSYWWFARAYATAMAVQALSRSETSPEERQATQRAGEWAARNLEERWNAFETALLARVLLLAAPSTPETQQAINWLLNSQSRTGSWRGSAALRVPRPDEHQPDRVLSWQRWLGPRRPIRNTQDLLEQTFTIYTLDQNDVFTTATVLETLLVARQTSSAGGREPQLATQGTPVAAAGAPT